MAGWSERIREGDIVVVTAESVNPGLSAYERAFVCDGSGFGTDPGAVGTAIFGEWLDGTGKERIERFNISTLETLAFRDGVAYVSALVLQARH